MPSDLSIAQLAERARQGDEGARALLKAMPAPTVFAVHGELRAEADAGMEIDGEFVNPATLSDERFTELVDQVRAGHMRALRFKARVFIDRPNYNLTRPKPGDLARIASGAAGALYLYDHSSRSVASRVGVVVSAEAVPFEDTEALVAVVDITDPGAQEKFLRGESDRFSIGLSAEEAECSVCGGEVTSSWWWWDFECGHEIGKSYPSEETGERVLAEAFLLGASMREVSTVNFPAVDDTAVLSQCGRPVALTTSGATPGEPQEASMADKKDDLAAQLAEAKAANEAREAELAKLREEKAASEAQLFDALFERGLAAGTLLPAEREDQKALFDAVGSERFKAALAKRQPMAGYQRTELGSASDSPSDAPVETDVLALAKRLIGRGISRENCTLERLDQLGFNELTIVELD